MALPKSQGLDTRSLIDSIKATRREILVCIIGMVLALTLRVFGTSADDYVAIALYNGVSNGMAITILFWIAEVGDLIWLPLVFLLYVFRKNKDDWTSSLVLAVAMVTVIAFTDLLKAVFNLQRPFQVSSLDIVARKEVPNDAGWPSGHAANAFTAATVIWSRYSSWRIPFLLLAVVTGLARIILGLHFPSDVLGGAFLGIACGTFALGLARLRLTQ